MTQTTSTSTPFQPPTPNFAPSGDLRRDLFHFREIYYNERASFPVMVPNAVHGFHDPSQDTRLIDAVRYTLEKAPLEGQDSTAAPSQQHEDEANDQEDLAPSAPPPELIEDLSNLPDEDLQHVLTSIHLQNVELTPQDTLALANAIRSCAFHVNEVKMLSVKLPSLVLLCRALREKRSLQVLAFDMSHERSLSDTTTGSDASESFGNADLVNDEMAQRLQEANAQNQKKGAKGAPVESSGPTPYDIAPEYLRETPLVAPLMTCARHISLRGCSLTDDDVQTLSKLLRNHSTVQTLSLWGNSITDRGAGYLARALQTNRSLIGLDLGMNRFTDEGAQKILQAFEAGEIIGLETLQEMRLDVYQSVHGARQFSSAEQLPIPAHLLPVILGKKGKAPKTTVSPLEWDEQIEIISVPEENDAKGAKKAKGAPVEEQQEIPLVVKVPGNQKLQYLSLANNLGVTDATGNLLVTLLTTAPTLNQVALTNSGVSEQCLQRVLEALNSTEMTKSDNEEE